jgi:acyl-CoA thioesterase
MISEKDKLAKTIYDTMIKKDHCAQWLAPKLVSIKEGYCQLEMTVRKEMLNAYGILHGGMAFTFADIAFSFAANSYGRKAVSINSSIICSNAAAEGEVLYAEATVINCTYKIADFDVNVKNEAGDIYYHFRGTVYRSSKAVLEN